MSSPSPPALQQLRHLNRSSSGFHDQLSKVLYGERYKQCVPDLQGDDLLWLVDYLDKVRCRISSPYSPLKSAQALDCLDPSTAASRKCLRELRTTCGARGMLPTSYTLSSDLLNISPEPFAAGGYGDVYEGTLDGSRVCIKRVKAYVQDGPQKAARVRYRRRRFPRSPPLTKPVDLLSRSHNVEKLETSKCLTATRYHYHSLPTRFESDVWRGSAGIHGEAP